MKKLLLLMMAVGMVGCKGPYQSWSYNRPAFFEDTWSGPGRSPAYYHHHHRNHYHHHAGHGAHGRKKQERQQPSNDIFKSGALGVLPKLW